MAILNRFNGTVSEIITINCYDATTGAPKTSGLTNTTTGLVISTRADGEAAATAYSSAASQIDGITTLGTYQAPATGHCRFAVVDATLMPGVFEIQLSNSRWSIAGARWLDIVVQCPGVILAIAEKYDLGPQVDVRAYGGTQGTASGGIPSVNMTQINGQTSRVTKLALEMDNRVTGTIGGSFTQTTTQFECTDISDTATFSVYQNRGFLITAGAMIKGVGIILSDQVGTSGRRFTVAALPQAPANGDTILIC